MKKLKKKYKKELTRITEYMISGGAWFWSGYILIVTLDGPLGEVFGERPGLFIANLIGNGVGLTINFVLNRYWVFKRRRQESLEAATTRYVIYTGLNAFLLNYLILQGLKTYAGLGPEIGQFIASGFFTVWNYLWYKAWVFKGTDKPARVRYHTH